MNGPVNRRADQRSARRRRVPMRDVDAAFRAHDAKVVDIAVREVRTARLNGLVRGFLLGLIAGLVIGATVFSAGAKAAPPPVAAPPLAWSVGTVEDAAEAWILDVYQPNEDGAGLYVVQADAACQRTRRRPARYRCEVAALWVENGEYSESRELLTYCSPRRGVRGYAANPATHRARFRVRRDGALAGGVICRWRTVA